MFSRAHVLSAFAAANQDATVPSALSTGEALLSQGDVLRRRAGQGQRNSPLLTNGLRFLRRALTEQLVPVFGTTRRTGSDAVAQRAKGRWDDWAADCGYMHQHGTFYQAMFRAAHAVSQDGEAFIQRVMVDDDEHANGLLLQVWSGRHRARWTTGLPDENLTEGLEFVRGRLRAVHFDCPDTSPYRTYGAPIQPNGRYTVRIPIEDLVWLRYALETDQIPGLPPAHASIEADAQLAAVAEASLTQQQVAACMAAVVIANDPHWGDNVKLGTRVTDSDGKKLDELEPGTVPVVHNAKDVKAVTPDQPTYPMAAQESRVAAGMGFTRELLTGNAGESSFSAMRFGDRLHSDTTAEWTKAVGWDVARAKVVRWWKAAEALQGRNYNAVTVGWLANGRVSLDPEKTVRAEVLEIENGLKSRAQAIRERGRDPREVRQEIEEENANETVPAQESDERHLHAC